MKAELRRSFLARAVELGPRWLAGRRSAELTALATEGVEALDGYFSKYLPQLILAAIVPVAVLVRVGLADPVAGLTIAATLPLVPVFGALVGKMTGAYAEQRWRALAVLSHHFLDVVSGLPTLKVFGRSKEQQALIGRVTGDYRQATMAHPAGGVPVLPRAGAGGHHVGRAGRGRGRAQPRLRAPRPPDRAPRADPGTGGVPAAAPVGRAVPRQRRRAGRRGCGHRGHRDSGPARGRSACPRPARHPRRGGQRRPPRPGPAGPRARFSALFRAGEITALAGPSGSGKSTLVDVLLGFARPSAGRVLVDGDDLAALDAETWRAQVGWVPQQPYLFPGTVAANIRLGWPDAPDDAVAVAARAAALDDLPLDRLVTERGGGLSSGQRRRVALARALLPGRPVLLLDEPTAGLDPETEERVLAALSAQAAAGRIVLIAAHHPRVIAAADRVAWLTMEEAPAPAAQTAQYEEIPA